MPQIDNLEQLISITAKVLKGELQASEELIAFIRQVTYSDMQLSQLAENISMLLVQKDVYAFRLEKMIEDFLVAQKEIDEARHDVLTGLPNRALFHFLLEKKCAESSLAAPLALFFVDLDKFKQINDTMGHDAGDEILCLASRRMQSCIKEQDILCRLGGDEFTVILSDFKGVEEVRKVGQRIVDNLCKPFKLIEGIGRIGGSIGISFFPADTVSPVTLIKNADIAMYKAKTNGRNRYEMFSSH